MDLIFLYIVSYSYMCALPLLLDGKAALWMLLLLQSLFAIWSDFLTPESAHASDHRLSLSPTLAVNSPDIPSRTNNLWALRSLPGLPRGC